MFGDMTIGHVLERAIIHLFAGGSVYLLTYLLTDYAQKKWRLWKMVLPALLAVGFIGWREAYDVANGQPFAKAITDWISWGLGLALAIYGLQRYIKLQAEK